VPEFTLHTIFSHLPSSLMIKDDVMCVISLFFLFLSSSLPCYHLCFIISMLMEEREDLLTCIHEFHAGMHLTAFDLLSSLSSSK
jgi:hypothetical protein